MIDSLLHHRQHAVAPAATLARESQPTDVLAHPIRFGLVTLHRPGNVDDPSALRESLLVLADIAGKLR